MAPIVPCHQWIALVNYPASRPIPEEEEMKDENGSENRTWRPFQQDL